MSFRDFSTPFLVSDTLFCVSGDFLDTEMELFVFRQPFLVVRHLFWGQKEKKQQFYLQTRKRGLIFESWVQKMSFRDFSTPFLVSDTF